MALPVRHVCAQPAGRTFRVGILRPSAAPASLTDLMAAGIPMALRELGYLESRNLTIALRWADSDPLRLPVLARELVQAKMDVIVAVTVPAVRAAREATASIPIVMYGNFDPIALGLVNSLARPGGNITGVLIAPDGTLAGKKLQLLKSAVPPTTRIGYLSPPADPSTSLQLQDLQQAARSLGIELVPVEVREADYARAFAEIARHKPGALFVAAHTFFPARSNPDHSARGTVPTPRHIRVARTSC